MTSLHTYTNNNNNSSNLPLNFVVMVKSWEEVSKPQNWEDMEKVYVVPGSRPSTVSWRDPLDTVLDCWSGRCGLRHLAVTLLAAVCLQDRTTRVASTAVLRP